MENLEKYIRNNRAQLDRIEEPETDLIWMSNQGQLNAGERENKKQ